MQVTTASKLKEKPPEGYAYQFGALTTDHMLECDYDKDNGGW